MRFAGPLLGLAMLAAPSLAVAQTTHASAPPATAGGATAPSAMPSPSTPKAAIGTGMSGGGSGSAVTHYSSQSAAASACGGDTVVWASPRSHALHTSDSKHFGKTKSGFYACEKQAMSNGYHMAGTGKHRKSAA